MKFNLFLALLAFIGLSISTIANEQPEQSNENTLFIGSKLSEAHFDINEIQPGDSDSVKVAKIQLRSSVANGLLQRGTQRELAMIFFGSTLIFSAAFVLFAIDIRDGLLGKVSEIGKFIDNIRLNKVTYLFISGSFVVIGAMFQLGKVLVNSLTRAFAKK